MPPFFFDAACGVGGIASARIKAWSRRFAVSFSSNWSLSLSVIKVLVPSKRYPAANRCIYCNADAEDLREEHIFPRGIGGRLILPRSSCLDCQGITTKFDSKFQNNMIGDLRTKMRFRSRMQRGEIAFDSLIAGEEYVRKYASAHDYPLVLTLPIFPLPEILLGRPWRTDEPKIRTVTNRAQVQRFTARHGAARRVVNFNSIVFARLLAKIAHSYALAELPGAIVASFQLCLSEIIRTEITEMPKRLVGGNLDLDTPSEYVHEAYLGSVVRNDTEYLVAQIRLFGFMESPTYHVVVGYRPFTGKPFSAAYVLLR